MVSLRPNISTPISQDKGAGPDLPNLEHATAVCTGPDAQDVLPVPHAQHGATHLLASIAELVANEGQEEVLPVPVRDTLLHPHYPLPALLVDIVFPDGADISLEEVVVRYHR